MNYCILRITEGGTLVGPISVLVETNSISTPSRAVSNFVTVFDNAEQAYAAALQFLENRSQEARYVIVPMFITPATEEDD